MNGGTTPNSVVCRVLLHGSLCSAAVSLTDMMRTAGGRKRAAGVNEGACLGDAWRGQALTRVTSGRGGAICLKDLCEPSTRPNLSKYCTS